MGTKNIFGKARAACLFSYSGGTNRAAKGRKEREALCVCLERVGLYVSWLGFGCVFYELGSTRRGVCRERDCTTTKPQRQTDSQPTNK